MTDLRIGKMFGPALIRFLKPEGMGKWPLGEMRIFIDGLIEKYGVELANRYGYINY